MALTMVGAFALGMGPASADDPEGTSTTGNRPSEQDVAQAREAVTSAANNVAGIQTQLIMANQRADDAWVASAQASEAYNGAQFEAQQAAAEAASAGKALAGAQRSADAQKASYGKTLVDQIQSGGNLQGVSVLLQTDGLDQTVQRAGAWQNVQDAMDGHWKQYKATATVASVSAQRAARASARSATLAAEADAARTAAAAAASNATAEASAVAAQRDGLIKELARLQNVSVQVANQRQAALEADAAAKAAEAAQAEAEANAARDRTTEDRTVQEQETHETESPVDVPTTAPTQQPTSRPSTQPTQQPTSRPSTQPTQRPTTQPTAPPTTRPTTTPTTTPPTTPPPTTTPPTPSGGAKAAIAYAKQQLGEPYVWGAAGPGSWDCSGLMLKAWGAGGKSLPHWSVGQYRASTPIKVTQLQPGDLVFWGSSSNSSSIYHVGLYIGDNQMIHAPRPGKGVRVESIYYWRTPNFFARP